MKPSHKHELPTLCWFYSSQNEFTPFQMENHYSIVLNSQQAWKMFYYIVRNTKPPPASTALLTSASSGHAYQHAISEEGAKRPLGSTPVQGRGIAIPLYLATN